jgi:hypothetical protein
MGLAVVRSIDAPRRLRTASELEDFEQELVDQYALASVASGVTDGQIAKERYVLFEFVRFLVRPVWTCQPGDALLPFPMQRNLAACGRAAMPPPPDPQRAAELDQYARAHAAARRWSKKQTDETR